MSQQSKVYVIKWELLFNSILVYIEKFKLKKVGEYTKDRLYVTCFTTFNIGCLWNSDSEITQGEAGSIVLQHLIEDLNKDKDQIKIKSVSQSFEKYIVGR